MIRLCKCGRVGYVGGRCREAFWLDVVITAEVLTMALILWKIL